VLEYAVSRDVGSGVFFEIFSGSALSFVDSDLEHGHVYFYKVKARNLIGWSEDSAQIRGVAGQLPTRITTQRIKKQSLTELEIEWEALSVQQAGSLPIINYLVKSDESDYIYGVPVENGILTSFKKPIQQPGNEGHIFRFRVAAQNELGLGEWSKEL
jgi:hypothetical protein